MRENTPIVTVYAATSRVVTKTRIQSLVGRCELARIVRAARRSVVACYLVRPVWIEDGRVSTRMEARVSHSHSNGRSIRRQIARPSSLAVYKSKARISIDILGCTLCTFIQSGRSFTRRRFALETNHISWFSRWSWLGCGLAMSLGRKRLRLGFIRV